MREFERFNTVCANAYVQPLMASYLVRLRDQLRQRGVACAHLPRAFRRRTDERRERSGLPGPTRRVRSGGRSDLRRRPRRPLRARSGDVVRHGRHDREDQPHRRLAARDGQDVRGRPHRPVQEGQRHADLDPGDRHDRDRCRRRFDRQRRLARPDPDRPAQRRLRARPGELLPRRPRCHGHRREPPARSAAPRHVRGDRHRPLAAAGDRCARAHGRRTARARRRHRRRSGLPRSSTRTWPTPPAPTPSRTARTWAATR